MSALPVHHIFPALQPAFDAYAIAERNAVLRLIEVANLIEKSMSVAEQPAMHARLRSDIDALKAFGLEA